MRLVRVATENPNSKFDGILQDDLTLQPDARIALHSLSLEQEELVLDTRGDSDLRRIKYTIDGTEFTTQARYIPAQQYAIKDNRQILEAVRDSLNFSTRYTPVFSAAEFTSATQGGIQQLMLGSEFDTYITNSGFTRVEYTKGNTAPHKDLLLGGPKGGVDEDYEVTDDIISKEVETEQGHTVDVWAMHNSVGDDAPPQVLACPEPLSRGTGYVEFCINKGIYNPNAPTDVYAWRGVHLCLSTTNLANLTAEEIIESYATPGLGAGLSNLVHCAIAVEFNAENGNVELDLITKNRQGKPEFDVLENLTSSCTTDDQGNCRIRLQLDKGRLNALYFKGQGNDPASHVSYDMKFEQDSSMDDVQGQDFYPFVMFFSNENYVEISELQLCLSTTDPSALPVAFTPAKGWDRALNPLVPLNNSVEMSIEFPSLDMGQYFGYSSARVPEVGELRGISIDFNAELPFGPRVTTQSIVVLCESFELDSYDSTQSQRKSILAVVPIERNNDGNVNIAPSPLFIGVKNINPIQFRNLRFRLVDGNYQPIKLYGTASMVVLIE